MKSEASQYQAIRRMWKKKISVRQRQLTYLLWEKKHGQKHPKLLKMYPLAKPALWSEKYLFRESLKLRREISELQQLLEYFVIKDQDCE